MNNEEMIANCSQKLVAISENVVSDDRKAAEKEFDVSYFTVHRYLKGQVKNIDLGVRLYEFFNERIEKRKAALA